MMYNPIEQFTIHTKLDLLFKYLDISISIPFILFSIIIFYIKYTITLDNITFKINFLILYIYDILAKQFNTILTIHYTNYLPLIIFSFFYILFMNLLGLIPYSFTITSQIIITLFWSTIIMIAVIFIGFYKHKLNFFYLFIPSGVPFILIPFIFIIELISYLSRVFSLSIRLSANMIAGHVLIYIITLFGIKLSILLKLTIVIPILMTILLLEIGVSVIQAYVFTILMTTYIKDSLYLH